MTDRDRLSRDRAGGWRHPPAKLIQQELGIPHRTASQWIIDARKAGRLEGMNYNAGLPGSD